MLSGIIRFELRYQLKNPVFLGFGCDILPARLWPDREPECQHRNPRLGARELTLRYCQRDRDIVHLLHVCGDSIRRKRHHPR